MLNMSYEHGALFKTKLTVGQAIGLAVKPLVLTPVSHIRVPGFESQRNYARKREMTQLFETLSPCGRPRLNSYKI